MFEKKAEEWVKNVFPNDEFKQSGISRALVDFAESGYSKANEWHFVKDGDYPKKTGFYLVAWKRRRNVEEYGESGFNVDFFNEDEGYFECDVDYVIAWKGIVLPKEN